MVAAEPGPDERRVRHLLARLGVRPLGHTAPTKDASVSDQPIMPKRTIPPSAPLPDRPPQPGEAPPWRTPPTARDSRPEPPPPDPPEVRVTVDLGVPAEPEPEPERWWSRVWDRIVTWRMLCAILAALLPWLNGQSPVGAWSHTVQQARTEAGVPAAYIIAGAALTAAWTLDRRTGRVVPRFLLVTTSLGALGVLNWWDPFLLLTGVSR